MTDGEQANTTRFPNWQRTALVALIAIVWLFQRQNDQRESRADREVCESLYGAGNCVKAANGRWVERGSTAPLD